MGSVECGRPCILAPSWWRYAAWAHLLEVIGGLVALIANSRSRLALFIWEWKAFGEGDHYWHGEGFWSVTYKEVSDTTKANQKRSSSFACIQACTPDLFATNLIIFLSNDGSSDCEWACLRRALHATLLDKGAAWYCERAKKLKEYIATDWPSPKLEEMSDTERLRILVAKCIFYMVFGVWLDKEDAEVMARWRDYAAYFVLPRLVQRFLFNFAICKVKQLRIDTVGLIEKHKLESFIIDINNKMPEKYRRTPTVKLADEILFIVGFAGVGGTSAACESVGAFLQCKIPEEASAHLISFEKYPTSESMVAAFKASPVTYIKEACRIDPPVTSATNVCKEARVVTLKGKQYSLPADTLNQYVLSMANRDTSVFSNPDVFDPTRKELNMALTWNGAFGTPDEEKVYPRICPGRHLALDVTQAVVGHFVGLQDTVTSTNPFSCA
ncbi:unnamed protein product [Effrenium voratum]|nr:unnamed protein product [Effrenium voratum]